MRSLYPIPGNKGDRKYDSHLYPALTATAIAEPFMGAASRSILYNHLPAYLGEINPAQRAIALAIHNANRYVVGYLEAYGLFWSGCEHLKDRVLSYAGKEKSQTLLKKEIPEIYEELTKNWKEIASIVYKWMHGTQDPRLAGYYAFCIRACFGNTMRLNPTGTRFNICWHVDKLLNADGYDPAQWVRKLQAIAWNPNVFDCWEDAISAVPNPESTYCLLDPPYMCSQSERMTPCYPNHSVTTKEGMDQTFALAIDSLAAALDRGFVNISVCNYFSDLLDASIKQLAADAGYQLTAVLMGECNTLGNSNGRRIHGDRVDKRLRPVEVIYQVTRAKKVQVGIERDRFSFDQIPLFN